MSSETSSLSKIIGVLSIVAGFVLGLNKFVLGAKQVIPGIDYIDIWMIFSIGIFCTYNHITVKKEKEERINMMEKERSLTNEDLDRLYKKLKEEYVELLHEKIDRISLVIETIDKRNDRIEKALDSQSEHILQLLSRK